MYSYDLDLSLERRLEVFVEDVEDPRTEVGFIAKFLLNGVPTNVVPT